ncbi:filamentous hemagglutinin N-terminal domain-containing protein, partial [uncultured Pluralibacter sp.]|uniref:two-partner secretion domain-containing protein n=1 Tax=uncultured Pluralibacter sp. TaxID=1490864 RepID=UPI00262452D8
MNKHCYRIIFNRARRMLVVVSELARARGGDTGRGPGSSSTACVASLRPLTLALWLAGGIASAPALADGIAADRGAPGGQQPTVMQTGNGLPQINIQTPNSQGLSHNKYSQFDVGERGAILNNGQHASQTQLAGQVAGNPWLAKGSAKVILNEVNSMNPSQLRGFIEVAGKKADVIIANPAGITCSGCGFINAGRNTLAAGRVRLENGQVAGYDIDRGRITISGGGMNGTGQDYTRLIARAVDVNARLQAGDLKITTGRNQTDADGNVTQVKADDPQGRPQFAVDTASLGGMYANRITLVGTERGVGVRNAGEIGATQGGFTLNAEGKLTNSGTLYSQQDLALKTAQLDNQGHISTGGSLRINNQGDATNKGSLSAEGDLQLDTSGRLHSQAGSALVAGGNTTINAQSLEGDSGSAMGAGIDGNGQATRGGQLRVTTSGRLASHGTHLTRDGFTASGSEVDLSGSQTRAAAVAAVARDGSLNTDSALIDAQQASLSSAHDFSSRGGAIAADRLDISAADKIDNSGGSLISRGAQGFTVSSKIIDNSGGTLASAGDLTLNSESLLNTGGELGSDSGNVTVRGGNISGAQGKMLAGKQLSVSGQQILMDGGLAQGQQLDLQADSLSMQGGHLRQTGQGATQINVASHLSSREGLIESAGAVNLHAGSLDNAKGRIASNGRLQLESGALDNSGGTLVAQQVDARTGAFTNREGTLESLQGLNLSASSLDSQQGFISADGGDAVLNVTGDINNRGGNLQSAKNLTINGGSLQNQDGRVLAAGGALQGHFSGGVDNGGGKLIAQQLALEAKELNNDSGVVSATSAASTLNLAGQFSNRGGTLESAGGLTLNAASLDNTGGRVATPGSASINLRGGSLINASTDASGLGILSGQTLTLNSGQVNNQHGSLQARQLDLTTGDVNNQAGYLGASEGLILNGGALDNTGGLISADTGAASLTLSGALSNAQGTLQSQQAMTLKAASLNNDGGKLLSAKESVKGEFSGDLSNRAGSILAGTAFDLSAGSVNNQKGIIAATRGSGSLASAGDVNNQAGDIESSGRLALNTGKLDNSGGQLLSSDAMQVSASGLSNDAGLIQASKTLNIDTRGGSLNNANTLTDKTGIRAGERLTLAAGDVNNRSGLISADQLSATGNSWNNQSGEISSSGNLDLQGASLDNAQGLVSAGKDLAATFSGAMINQKGTLQGSQNLNIDAGSLNNDSGALLAAGGNAGVKVKDAFSNQQGQLLAKNDAGLSAGSVDNQSGRISALNGGAVVGAVGNLLNRGGSIDTGGALRLSGSSIDNGDGQLVAAGGSLSVTGGDISNQHGRMAARDNVEIRGSALNNQDGTVTSVGGDLSARLDGAIDNQRGVLQSGHGVTLNGSSLDNRSGSVLAVDGENRIDVQGDLLNGGGQITGSRKIDLRAGHLDNQSGAVSSRGGALDVSVSGAIDNQKGALEADGPVQITAGTLNNSGGGSLLSASDSLTASVTGELNNQGGRIAARKNTTLTADGLNNQQGTVTAVDEALTVNGGSLIDNSGGTLQSSGDLTLGAASLNNRSGTVQSAKGSGQLNIDGALDNQLGTLSAAGALALNSGEMNNGQGVVVADSVTLTSQGLNNQAGLIQGIKGLEINTQGQLLNNSDTNSDTTGLRTGGALTLNTGDLNNQSGLIAGDTLALNGQSVNNRGGSIGSTRQSQLTTGAIDNQTGTIQSAGSISIDTRGADLHNEQGKVLADSSLDIRAGAIGNGQGLIQGGAGLTLAGSVLDNTRGQTLSGGDLTASVDRLNNESGLLYAAGNAQINAGQSVQNQQGLLKAGKSLTLTTDVLDNQNTRDSGQGVEAQDLTLNAATLNNQSGALRAGDNLHANVRGQLNNQNGLISSQNSLTIGQADQRTNLLNSGGDIVANGDAGLWLGQLDGVGRITSGGSMNLDVASALNQDGSLAAGNDFTLNTNGNALTNTGSITAGNQLNLSSGHLDNQQGGEINAGSTRVNAGDIVNRGLIDGGSVVLRTGDLHNTGTGRIYGDQLAIDARTLLNDKSGDTAATIAARNDLTIATDHLTNQDHGLIYSNGGMRIGGALSDAGELSGRAALVENLSATMEAMGDLQIDAAKTENRDIHITVSPDLKVVTVSPNVLEVELCSGLRWPEGCGRTNGEHYRFKGHVVSYEQEESSPVAFDFDQDGRSYALDEQGNRVTVNVNGKDEYVYLWLDAANKIIYYNLPGVTGNGRRFDVFSFTESVKEQQATGQDSAVIRSGGNLTLNSDLHNKDSQVVAGQDLTINGAVNNDETTVRQEVTRDGVVIRGGRRKEHSDTHFEGQGAYQPPLQITDVPLHLTVQQQGQGRGDGRTIDGQKPTTGGTDQASGLNGGADLASRGDQTLVTEVALPPNSSVDTRLRPVTDTLSDNAGHAGADLQTRGAAADGLTDVALSGAGSLTGTSRGSADATQGGAGLDGTRGSVPGAVPPGQDNWVLRSVTGPVKLPDNSLFVLHPGTDSHYLVETDPRFTQGKKALSSGDFYSSDQLQKRLGDGYYEQSLVRDQLVKATGQRYLPGYSSDEDQYRDLLTSGKSFSDRFNIAPGADLSPEQMAQVTQDMVLMVNQTVTLPDGSTQVVSVPKLYARVKPGELKGDGALLSGNNVRITTAGDVINSGSISGRGLTAISAGNLLNTGDISGDRTQLVAAGNIVNRSGRLSGDSELSLRAGNDILSLTESHQQGSEGWLGRQAELSVTGDGGVLSLESGHDIRLTASTVSNQGKDSITRMVSGNDLTLDTARTSHATDFTRSRKNYDRTLETREVGTVIGAGGDLLMQSGHDMNLRAANVTAAGSATMVSGNDINLMSGVDTWDQSSGAKWTKHGTFKKTTTQIKSEVHQTTAAGSTVSGDQVTMVAGNNLTSQGSNVLGTRDVTVSVGNNLTVTTADESDHSEYSQKKKKSGLGSTGGLGITVGSSSQKVTNEDASNVKKGSVFGSSEGNLTLTAGNGVVVHGSDLVAGNNMTLEGK